MMTAQDKERYDTLVDTIDECLEILNKDFGTAFIISTLTRTDDEDNAFVHSGCYCTLKEALVLFSDLIEDEEDLVETMRIIVNHAELKNK